MRIKNQLLLGGIGWLGSTLIRTWMGTLQHTLACADWRLDPAVPQSGQIYAVWHDSILAAAHVNRDRGIHVLISQSKDGEYITRVVERLGFHAVRGSSTRGGLRAVRGMARAAEQSRLAITPDGPRGPRHVFQAGAIYLASRTGMPIVPVGTAYSRAWRARSWDRFVVPCPGSRVVGYFGQPLFVPPDLEPDELEVYRQRAQEVMQESEDRAARLLHGSALPSKADTTAQAQAA